MKTTIDLPDDLFRKAKATAALRGESLKSLISTALRHELERVAAGSGEPGWRRLYGVATPEQVAEVDLIVGKELAQVDEAEWH